MSAGLVGVFGAATAGASAFGSDYDYPAAVSGHVGLDEDVSPSSGSAASCAEGTVSSPHEFGQASTTSSPISVAPNSVHSRYSDGTPVFEGQQPGKVKGPNTEAAGAPHSQIQWDYDNGRIYKAREYGADGIPVRDIDFTHQTYPSGRPRPDHAVPEQHPWIPNDPDNPKAGHKRGPGEPLEWP